MRISARLRASHSGGDKARKNVGYIRYCGAEPHSAYLSITGEETETDW